MLEIAGGIVLGFVFISLVPVILEPLLKLGLTCFAIVVMAVVGVGLYFLWDGMTAEGVLMLLIFWIPILAAIFFYRRSQDRVRKEDELRHQENARIKAAEYDAWKAAAPERQAQARAKKRAEIDASNGLAPEIQPDPNAPER